jgi:peptidoglycan hydrolase-like protein with peptidoglycan-binding domain
MIWNYKLVRNAVLSFVMAGGMAGFATLAQAHSYTKSEMASAQQLLKNCGYYSGKVNGKNSRETKAAIRKYQRTNNLTVNGHLDWQTRNRLGVKKSA